MGARFNKPPAWPQPSDSWEPVRDWILDPKWSTPPAPEPQPTGPARWIPAARRPRPTSPPRPPRRPEAARPAEAAPVEATPVEATPVEADRPTASTAAPTSPAATPPAAPAAVAPAAAPAGATQPSAARPNGQRSPSLSSLVLELGTPLPAAEPHARTRFAPLRPTPIRMIGWGALGVILIVVAAVTVGDLAEPPPTPAVDATRSNPAGAAGPTDPIEAAIARAAPGTALAALAELKVQPRGTSEGYARSEFGSARADVDGNGCDQRNDVLRRDLTDTVLEDGCTVLSGTLLDPYTGQTISYQRAPDQPTQIQIDHVVPLGDAWLKGARDWSAAKRAAFNADPLNLLAVGANVTAGKRASDAARWLPEATSYRCTYVARQVAVKHAYGIWVTAAERTAIARILTGCADLQPPRTQTIALS